MSNVFNHSNSDEFLDNYYATYQKMINCHMTTTGEYIPKYPWVVIGYKL